MQQETDSPKKSKFHGEDNGILGNKSWQPEVEAAISVP